MLQILFIGNYMPTITYLFLKNTSFIMYLYNFGPLRWLRICAIVGIVITTAFYTSVTVAMLAFIVPRHGESWSESSMSKHQQQSAKLPALVSSFGVVIDLVILILPIIAVSQLQLPAQRRRGLILVFMTGSLLLTTASV